MFLGVAPLQNRAHWKQLVHHPITRAAAEGAQEEQRDVAWGILRYYVTQLMWRNTKADVEDQLAIPPQAERVHDIVALASRSSPPPVC